MVYGVKWRHDKAAECQQQAEVRACRPGEVWGLGYLYRFEEHSYAAIDYFANPISGEGEWYITGPHLELEAFLIRSRTPHGWTIKASNGNGWRFISETTTKRYALPTVAEALQSYIARKEKQAQIYEARAKRARKMIAVARNERLPYCGA